MRVALCCVFGLLTVQAVFGQATGNATVGAASLPKDPRDMFAAAAPSYDFSDASLKPWHLKVSYQLYGDKGDPAEKGTFEYWWASPEVYRTTWTRGNSTQTTWHTAQNKRAYQATGEPLKYFEHKLQSALLSPLPKQSELDPAKYRLDRQPLSLAGAKFPCIMVEPIMIHPGALANPPLGLFPTYCFDTNLPVLRISYSMGSVVEEFNKIEKVQNKYLSQDVEFFEGKRRLLSASVDSVTGLALSDPALTPPPQIALRDDRKVAVPEGVAMGMLLNKQVPVYPQDAKEARITGEVVLQATIGTDGGVHDLRVISAPWPSMAEAALWAVSQWQYKPYQLNGEPVEVETTVRCIFALGR